MRPPELFPRVKWKPASKPDSDFREWVCSFGFVEVRLCQCVRGDASVGFGWWYVEINGESLCQLTDSPLAKSDVLDDLLGLTRRMLTEAAEEIRRGQRRQLTLAKTTPADALKGMSVVIEEAERSGVTIIDVLSRSRGPKTVAARKRSARRLSILGYSLKQIGSILRRDPSTVHTLVHNTVITPRRSQKA